MPRKSQNRDKRKRIKRVVVCMMSSVLVTVGRTQIKTRTSSMK